MNLLKITLASMALFLVGCETMPDRFAAVPPRVRTVDGEAEAVQQAAQKAFKRLGFNVTRVRSGSLEAVSAINTSETFGDSRQTVVQVQISEAGPGHADVAVGITQETGSASFGGTHREALREHSFFAAYFAMLQQVLQEQAEGQGVEKN